VTRRAAVSLCLSVLLHLSALLIFTPPFSALGDVSASAVMRVTLGGYGAAGREGAPGVAEPLTETAKAAPDEGVAEPDEPAANDEKAEAEAALPAREEILFPEAPDAAVEIETQAAPEPTAPEIPAPEPIAPEISTPEPVAPEFPAPEPQVREPEKILPGPTVEKKETTPPKPEVKKPAPAAAKPEVKKPALPKPKEKNQETKQSAKPAAKTPPPAENKNAAAASGKNPPASPAPQGGAPNETAGGVGADNSNQPQQTRQPESAAPSSGIVDAESLKVIKKISPEYPMISRKRKEQGVVTLVIEIVSGRVASAKVERTSGHAPLDEAALKAVKGWKFNTSGYGDRVMARIPFRFDLK
jgi:protein TonB